MSAAFTPAPWNVGRQRKVYAGVETPVAQSIAVNGNYPEAIANARLIAAAPELYEALEGLLESYLDALPGSDDYGPVLEAQAALTKARGEQ